MIFNKNFTIIFVLLFIPQFHCKLLKNNHDLNFIAEYFSIRNIQRIVLFSNWSKKGKTAFYNFRFTSCYFFNFPTIESMDAIKYFSGNDIRISLIDMNYKMTQKETHDTFQPQIGIFYDFCHHDSRTSFLQVTLKIFLIHSVNIEKFHIFVF